MAPAIQVTLTHHHDTKGTRVFKSDEDVPITSLYIRKPQADSLPDKISVSVEGK